tara:strand:- start:802 stop:1116 length:315 start_codon:yes stop_codon:yes gene_type:complete
MNIRKKQQTIYESKAGDYLHTSESFIFEIIEDESGSCKERMIKLTNRTEEQEIVLLVKIDTFSEAVAVFRNQAANRFDHTNGYSEGEEIKKLSQAFEPVTPWED